MSDQCECPICMDVIDLTKNCVVTDCGHKFHCSCLMQNAVHNGFGCPFCRTAMADEPKEEDDDEDQWSDVSDQEELYDDYVLRGFRFMTNNLEGIPHDILDVYDENEDERRQEEEQERDTSLPTAAFIANKLAEQGVTMEYLVKALLVDHGEYEDDGQFNDLDEANDDIFGKMRIIISNYTPPPPVVDDVNVDEPAPLPAPQTPIASSNPISTPSAPPRHSSSEPKTYATTITPRRLVSEFMHDE